MGLLLDLPLIQLFVRDIIQGIEYGGLPVHPGNLLGKQVIPALPLHVIDLENARLLPGPNPCVQKLRKNIFLQFPGKGVLQVPVGKQLLSRVLVLHIDSAAHIVQDRLQRLIGAVDGALLNTPCENALQQLHRICGKLDLPHTPVMLFPSVIESNHCGLAVFMAQNRKNHHGLNADGADFLLKLALRSIRRIDNRLVRGQKGIHLQISGFVKEGNHPRPKPLRHHIHGVLLRIYVKDHRRIHADMTGKHFKPVIHH